MLSAALAGRGRGGTAHLLLAMLVTELLVLPCRQNLLRYAVVCGRRVELSVAAPHSFAVDAICRRYATCFARSWLAARKAGLRRFFKQRT
eukprot:1417585-Pleurochrysis_carterae.AAC.2